MTSSAEHHEAAATIFAERIAGTTDWDAPTPVKEWRARDIVEHLLEWFPGMLAAGSDIRLAEVDTTDLAAAWAARSADVQAILDDPSNATATYSSPMVGEMPLADMVDRFYTADIMMHTWDLSRATGQEDTLPPERVKPMYEGMSEMEDAIRSSGQFGEQQPVADDAPLQDKFLAFIGRDPQWQPPAADAEKRHGAFRR